MAEFTDDGNVFSTVVIALMKGVMYADDNPKLWQQILNLQARIRDYVKLINLELVIFEDEGFAWLKTIVIEDDKDKLPSLISKRQLSYPVSLLLALLRQRLAEHDASSSESRLILGRDEIKEMVKTFFSSGTNEVRIVNQIDSCINKVEELGFVRILRTDKNKVEVRRILKAFIDAQWLNEFELRLSAYRNGGIAE